jgi:hypothetical protein
MTESSSSSPKLSFTAIVVIAANTMNGPGLTTLPSIASASGQVTFSVLVTVAALITSFVVHRLVSVMWNAHHHHQYQQQYQQQHDDEALIKQIPTASSTSDDNEFENLLENTEDGGGAGVNIVVIPVKVNSASRRRPRLKETDIVVLSEKLFGLKKLASLAMIGCALSLALAQMMLCAAIADSMLVASVGQSCGLGMFDIYCTSNLSMKPFQMMVIPQDDDNNNMDMATTPPVSLISAGLVLASSITISLATVDLDSLVVAQYFLFGCLLVACSRFYSTLRDMGDVAFSEQDATWFGEEDTSLLLLPATAPFWIGPRPFDAVGPILFNFAFVVTAPPLVCGADSPASGTRALVVACVLMGALYILIGRVGANAATNTGFGLDDNLLSLVLRGRHDPDSLDVWDIGVDVWDIGAVSLFGLSQLASIPVYCELARETIRVHLQVTHNKPLALFVASHVCPWILVALTYNSALFEEFVDWSSLLLLGFANFSLPLLLDHVYTQRLKLDEGGRRCNYVVWGLALITAGISAVIVQQLTESLALAQLVFTVTTLAVFQLEYLRSTLVLADQG